MKQEPVLLFEQQRPLLGTLLFRPENIDSVEVWEKSSGSFRIEQIEDVELLLRNAILLHSENSKRGLVLQNGGWIKPPNSPDAYPATHDGKHWLLFSETGLFHKMQVRISYTHKDAWTGFVPVPSPTKLSVTKQKLAAGDPLDIFVFGDSISTGANCSKSLNLAPFSASYPELFVEMLHKRFPKSEIRLKNESVGGQSSEWGAHQVSKILRQAGNFKFDLNIIAWGMNDSTGKRSTKLYLRNIAKHVKLIKQKNPTAEFILVGSSLPNPLWNGAHHDLLYAYAEGLRRMAVEGESAIEFANVTQLWRDILERKNYYDLTGNGINHPNDFGHQLYAQVIATLLQVYTI